MEKGDEHSCSACRNKAMAHLTPCSLHRRHWLWVSSWAISSHLPEMCLTSHHLQSPASHGTPQRWPRAAQMAPAVPGSFKHTLQQAPSPNQQALKHTAVLTAMDSCFPEHNCSGVTSKQVRARSNLRLNTHLLIFRVWVGNFPRMKLKALRGHSNWEEFHLNYRFNPYSETQS